MRSLLIILLLAGVSQAGEQSESRWLSPDETRKVMSYES